MKKDIEQQQKTETRKPAEPQNFFGEKKEILNSIDVEDKIELERRDAYIEPETRDLLRCLLQEGDKTEILPLYSPGLGFVYQLSCSKLIKNETGHLSIECLENLVKLDILKKSFFDSVSTCPNCESTIMTLHNRCPKCKSHNVEKTSLTEHIPCGYIDQRDKYIKDRCPKCGDPLIEGQYRNMGRWYVCQECGEKFENPEFDLICRSCNKSFTIKDAKVTEIPKFSLNLARKKEIRQNVASLENIRELLVDLGFEVEIPGLATGQKSGMEHHFSLIAKKQIKGHEIIIALDHAISESEVQASPLILYIYKTSEVKVDIPVFVAMPVLSETAKKIAQGHEILLIEGSADEKESVENIKRQIQSRIETKLTEYETANKKPESKPKNNFIGKLTGFGKK